MAKDKKGKKGKNSKNSKNSKKNRNESRGLFYVSIGILVLSLTLFGITVLRNNGDTALATADGESVANTDAEVSSMSAESIAEIVAEVLQVVDEKSGESEASQEVELIEEEIPAGAMDVKMGAPLEDGEVEVVTETDSIDKPVVAQKVTTVNAEPEEIEEEIIEITDEDMAEAFVENPVFLPEESVEVDPLEAYMESLSTEANYCTFQANGDHLPVTSYIGIDIEAFGAYSIVDTEEKVIYLTFDTGYETGYTESILDTLLENGVQATFFVHGSYLRNNAALVTRMKEEGHLVGNQSMTCQNFTEISDEEIVEEIIETEALMFELTGYEMDAFVRPPQGAFSERSLYITQETGNRTILWSMTYADWDVDNQPGKAYAYYHVMENYHNGAIILLRTVSESNSEALDSIIDSLKALGYRFGNLYEVE